jgi:hypothetical protein
MIDANLPIPNFFIFVAGWFAIGVRKELYGQYMPQRHLISSDLNI